MQFRSTYHFHKPIRWKPPFINMSVANSSIKMNVEEVPEKLVEPQSQEPKQRAMRNHDNPVGGNHPDTVTLLTGEN